MKEIDLYGELDKLETKLILSAIKESRDIAHAAKNLKINRTTLIEKMRKLGIKVEKQSRLIINGVAMEKYK